MIQKKKIGLLLSVLTIPMLLSACGNGNDEEKEKSDGVTEVKIVWRIVGNMIS